jgi:hypothetical protein
VRPNRVSTLARWAAVICSAVSMADLQCGDEWRQTVSDSLMQLLLRCTMTMSIRGRHDKSSRICCGAAN